MMGNTKLLYLVILIALVLTNCSSANTEPISPTTVRTIKTRELSQCPIIGGGGSWERYKPYSFEKILDEANQVSSLEKNSGMSFYVETNNDYQFPSCVVMKYSGNYREIADERKILIQAWSGIFGAERSKQIVELLKHEVLLIDNEKEYWIPVQEQLAPYMEGELTKNEPVIVFIIWIGSIYLRAETDHVFVLGEFAKP